MVNTINPFLAKEKEREKRVARRAGYAESRNAPPADAVRAQAADVEARLMEPKYSPAELASIREPAGPGIVTAPSEGMDTRDINPLLRRGVLGAYGGVTPEQPGSYSPEEIARISEPVGPGIETLPTDTPDSRTVSPTTKASGTIDLGNGTILQVEDYDAAMKKMEADEIVKQEELMARVRDFASRPKVPTMIERVAYLKRMQKLETMNQRLRPANRTFGNIRAYEEEQAAHLAAPKSQLNLAGGKQAEHLSPQGQRARDFFANNIEIEFMLNESNPPQTTKELRKFMEATPGFTNNIAGHAAVLTEQALAKANPDAYDKMKREVGLSKLAQKSEEELGLVMEVSGKRAKAANDIRLLSFAGQNGLITDNIKNKSPAEQVKALRKNKAVMGEFDKAVRDFVVGDVDAKGQPALKQVWKNFNASAGMVSLDDINPLILNEPLSSKGGISYTVKSAIEDINTRISANEASSLPHRDKEARRIVLQGEATRVMEEVTRRETSLASASETATSAKGLEFIANVPDALNEDMKKKAAVTFFGSKDAPMALAINYLRDSQVDPMLVAHDAGVIKSSGSGLARTEGSIDTMANAVAADYIKSWKDGAGLPFGVTLTATLARFAEAGKIAAFDETAGAEAVDNISEMAKENIENRWAALATKRDSKMASAFAPIVARALYRSAAKTANKPAQMKSLYAGVVAEMGRNADFVSMFDIINPDRELRGNELAAAAFYLQNGPESYPLAMALSRGEVDQLGDSASAIVGEFETLSNDMRVAQESDATANEAKWAEAGINSTITKQMSYGQRIARDTDPAELAVAANYGMVYADPQNPKSVSITKDNSVLVYPNATMAAKFKSVESKPMLLESANRFIKKSPSGIIGARGFDGEVTDRRRALLNNVLDNTPENNYGKGGNGRLSDMVLSDINLAMTETWPALEKLRIAGKKPTQAEITYLANREFAPLNVMLQGGDEDATKLWTQGMTAQDPQYLHMAVAIAAERVRSSQTILNNKQIEIGMSGLNEMANTLGVGPADGDFRPDAGFIRGMTEKIVAQINTGDREIVNESDSRYSEVTAAINEMDGRKTQQKTIFGQEIKENGSAVLKDSAAKINAALAARGNLGDPDSEASDIIYALNNYDPWSEKADPEKVGKILEFFSPTGPGSMLGPASMGLGGIMERSPLYRMFKNAVMASGAPQAVADKTLQFSSWVLKYMSYAGAGEARGIELATKAWKDASAELAAENKGK